MNTITSLKPPEWLPPTARSYYHLSQLWQVPAFLVGVVAMVWVLAGAAIHHGREHQELVGEFRDLRSLLQSSESDLTNEGNAIPEPASLTLFGLGLIGFAYFYRRRRNRYVAA